MRTKKFRHVDLGWVIVSPPACPAQYLRVYLTWHLVHGNEKLFVGLLREVSGALRRRSAARGWCSRRRLKHAGIVVKVAFDAHPDARKLGMAGIQNGVAFFAHERGGHVEHERATLTSPPGAELQARRPGRHEIPAWRKVGQARLLGGMVPGQLDSNEHEVARHDSGEVDESLEGGDGDRAARVDHARTRVIPAAARFAGADT